MIATGRKIGTPESLAPSQRRKLLHLFDKTLQPASVLAFDEELKNAKLRCSIQPEITGQPKLLVLTTNTRPTRTSNTDNPRPFGVGCQVSMLPDIKFWLSGAHACYDPRTGEWFKHSVEIGDETIYRVFHVSPRTGKVDVLAQISDRAVRSAHVQSILLTENFVVLCIWSSILKDIGMNMLWTRSDSEGVDSLDPDKQVTWLVIDRKDGDLVKRYTSSAYIGFNTTNAWEKFNRYGTIDVICEIFEVTGLVIPSPLQHNRHISGSFAWSNSSQLARYKLSRFPLKTSN